jgi:ubiquinone/menaquinone biosynthesis C-methylase UbiE
VTPAVNVVACGSAPRSSDLSAVKARQQAVWASGDFAVIGTTLQIVGELLCEAVDLRGGEPVLDVAAGNGNASLAAARRFARVTSTDYVPALLERGRQRAEAERLGITFETADAENLPYPPGAFDVVLSTFGVMFAPDHRRAAHEMLRVCRPDGRIGLACWTPGGFLGALFRTVATHVPPIPGVASPLLWGKADYIDSLFERASSITCLPRTFAFRYDSAEHFVDVFRRYYGPIHAAFASLDESGRAALERDLVALVRRSDTGGGRGLVIHGEYLEIVIRK